MDTRKDRRSDSRLNEHLPASFDCDRLAQLVANGQIDLPIDQMPNQLMHVIKLVRERRRQHLMSHIAHCIALDIVSNNNKQIGDRRND